MADWTKPFTATYTWRRVDRKSYTYFKAYDRRGDYYATGYEVGTVDNITGGTLQLNDSTETFETGVIHCVGPIDIGTDLLRCHLIATWGDGTYEDVVLGTYNVSVPSRDVHGSYEECSAILDGRLMELQQDAFEEPQTVPKGDNVGYHMSLWLRTRGITFSEDRSHSETAIAARRDYTFGLGVEDDDGGTVLSAYNAMAVDVVGLRAANTDPFGRVIVQDPIDYDGVPVWTFAEGVNATFLTDATDEFDTSGVCNVAVCIFETGDETTIGTAEDTDASSPWSIANYGRRKVAVYTYNEEPKGSTQVERQASADAKAAQLLGENRSVVRRVTIRHTYCPARVGDLVEIYYPSAGISGKFAIRTQTIEVGSGGCITTSELRRFERV